MVGLTISLIGTFAMMQAFAVFEAQKRTTTSGNDAQEAGSYSLFEIERQIRTAGSAIAQGKNYSIWGCNISARNGATTLMPGAAPAPFDTMVSSTVRAIPVLVYSAGAGASDMLQVFSGNPAVRTFSAQITSAPSATAVVLKETVGIYPSEYLLATDKSNNCRIGLIASPGTSVDSTTNTVTLDATGSLATGFQAQTYLFDLGLEPAVTLFGVDTNFQRLMSFDRLQRTSTTPTELSDGIIRVRALYGVDDGVGGTADDGIIDEWVAATGVWAASALNDGTAAAAVKIARIKAVRVAVIARNQLQERDPVGATTVTLFPDLTALSDVVVVDNHYRYKIYDTTVPLHNALVTKFF